MPKEQPEYGISCQKQKKIPLVRVNVSYNITELHTFHVNSFFFIKMLVLCSFV